MLRKFFLVISAFILIVLLSAGIHQKLDRADGANLNSQTVGTISTIQ